MRGAALRPKPSSIPRGRTTIRDRPLSSSARTQRRRTSSKSFLRPLELGAHEHSSLPPIPTMEEGKIDGGRTVGICSTLQSGFRLLLHYQGQVLAIAHWASGLQQLELLKTCRYGPECFGRMAATVAGKRNNDAHADMARLACRKPRRTIVYPTEIYDCMVGRCAATGACRVRCQLTRNRNTRYRRSMDGRELHRTQAILQSKWEHASTYPGTALLLAHPAPADIPPPHLRPRSPDLSTSSTPRYVEVLVRGRSPIGNLLGSRAWLMAK